MIPIVLVLHISSCTPNRVHSPLRTLRMVLPGHMVKNTSQPHAIQDSVLMAMDIKTPFGGTWQARIFSNKLEESNLFVMDQHNIPVAHAHITSSTHGGVTKRLTLYNHYAIPFLISYILQLIIRQQPRHTNTPHFTEYKHLLVSHLGAHTSSPAAP
jgi:hypothetical protein